MRTFIRDAEEINYDENKVYIDQLGNPICKQCEQDLEYDKIGQYSTMKCLTCEKTQVIINYIILEDLL